MPANRIRIALLLLFIASAAVLRLAVLDAEGLWVDEGYTYRLQEKSAGEIVESLRNDDAPPLFYLAAHGVRSLLDSAGLRPEPEIAVRAVPALCSLLAVLLLAWARRGDPSEWATLLLFGLSSYAVFYGRQGRSYGWILFWMVAVIVSAQRVAAGKKWTWTAGLALSLSVVLWSHNLGLVVWGAGVSVFGLFYLRDRRRGEATGGAIRGLVAHGMALLSVLPWHLATVNQMAYHNFSNQWMGDYWKEVPLAFAPFLSLVVFGPGSPMRPPAPANLPQPQETLPFLRCLLVTGALIIVPAWGLLRLLFRSRIGAAELRGRAIAIETAYLAVSLLAPLAVTLLYSPSYVLGRTDVVAFPAFAMLAGRGLALMDARARRGILACATILSVAVSLPLLGIGSSPRFKEKDRRLARELSKALAPRDLVVYTALTGPSLESYLGYWNVPHRVDYFPPVTAANPATIPVFSVDSVDAYRAAAIALRERLESGEADRMIPLVRLLPGVAPLGAKTAQDLVYPHNVLAYVMGGMRPLPLLAVDGDSLRYTHDWLGGHRMVLVYTRDDLIDLDSLGGIEVQR